MIPSSVLKNWAVNLFGILIVLGAIAFVPLSSLGFVLPKLFFFSLAGIVGMLIVIMEYKESILTPLFRTHLGQVFLLFFGVALISTIWSIAPLLSIVGTPPRFDGLLSYSTYFAIALTSFALIRLKHRKELVSVIVWSNGLIVFYAFLQMIKLDPLFHIWYGEEFLGRLFSTIGQPQFLGIFILLTVPFLVIRINKSKGKLKLLLSLIAILNVIVLAGCACIASYIGLLTVLGALIYVYMKNAGKRTKAFRLVSLLTSISILLIAFIFIATILNRYAFFDNNLNLKSRSSIFKTSVNMIESRPIGIGLDTMALSSSKFIRPDLFELEPLDTVVDSAHSKPFDLFVSLGPLGFITYYVFLVSLLITLWKKREKDILLASFYSLLGASVALLFSYDTAILHVFFWLIAGMSLGFLLPMRRKGSVKLEQSVVMMATFLVMISFMVFSQWNVARIKLYESDLYFANEKLIDAFKSSDESLSIFPLDRTALIRSAQNLLVAHSWLSSEPNTRYKDLDRRSFLQFKTDKTLKALNTLTSGNDGTVDVLSAWNESLRFLDFDPTNVEELTQRAFEKSPSHIPTLKLSYHVYESIGKHDEAKKVKDRILELIPNFEEMEADRRKLLLNENAWLREMVN